eukprot:SAG11_NODE_30812_length_297_cov_1.030303_2_plen_23_part_01
MKQLDTDGFYKTEEEYEVDLHEY